MKPQLACFERLGWPGWRALEQVGAAARDAGLLVVADGKRGDVPVSATAYGQALFGSVETPWGEVRGLAADAATVNPLLGGDALEPLIAAAADSGRRRLRPRAHLQPGGRGPARPPAGDAPLHERLAADGRRAGAAAGGRVGAQRRWARWSARPSPATSAGCAS